MPLLHHRGHKVPSYWVVAMVLLNIPTQPEGLNHLRILDGEIGRCNIHSMCTSYKD